MPTVDEMLAVTERQEKEERETGVINFTARRMNAEFMKDLKALIAAKKRDDSAPGDDDGEAA